MGDVEGRQVTDQTTAWDGYPLSPDRPGYHWLRRTDAISRMPAVIWTWRPEVQAWRWKGEAEIGPAEQAATKAYIAPVTDHAEVERMRKALRVIAGSGFISEALAVIAREALRDG